MHINNSKNRKFLKLCVELANAKQESWEYLFNMAVIREDIKTNLAGDSFYAWCQYQVPDLVAVVRMLGHCVSTEESFSITHSDGWMIDCDKRCVSRKTTGNKLLTFSRLHSRSKLDQEKDTDIIGEIAGNELIGVFFDVLQRVVSKTSGQQQGMLPIRQCQECDQIFLARRYDQMFCNQQHSQRSRSRDRYRNK